MKASSKRGIASGIRGGHWPPCYVTLLLSAVVTSLHAADWHNQTRFDSFSYSAPVPLATVSSDWEAPLESGTAVLSWNRLSIGVARNGQRLAITRRALWQARFNAATARFIHLTKNHLPLPADSRYPLALQVDYYDLGGVEASLPLALGHGLSLTLTPAWLEGERITHGSLHGSAVTLADKDYDLQLQAETRYRNDPLFGRSNPPPSGQGYALDLNLSYRHSHALRLEVDYYNALGRIWWQGLAATTASADTRTKQYDSDGYLIFSPTLSGREYTSDWQQRLPRRVTARLDWQLDAVWALRLEHLASAPLDLNSLVIMRDASGGGRWQFGYTPRLHSYSLGWHHPLLGITLGGDAGAIDDLHQLTLQMRLELPLHRF